MSVRFRLLAPAALGMLAVVGRPATAVASSSVQSGWWTSAPVAVAPDVADDQLLVQGNPDTSQPLAYVGISFALAAGEVPTKLVLSVAPSSATTPGATLALCRLGAIAYAAKGDAASGGPPFDCAAKVEASPSANGAAYEFDATAMATAGAVDVAVVPTQPTDRVVLTKPTVDSLQTVSDGSTLTSPTEPSDVGGVVAGSATGGLGEGGTFPLDLGNPGAATEAPISPGVTPAATAQPDADASTPVVRLTRPVASQQPDGTSRPITPFVFGGMAVGAAALWALAGQRSPETAGETAETGNTGEPQ